MKNHSPRAKKISHCKLKIQCNDFTDLSPPSPLKVARNYKVNYYYEVSCNYEIICKNE